MTATYMYAVTNPLTDSSLERLCGVGGAVVRILDGDQMSCLVSTVDLNEFGEDALRDNLEDLVWLERTAREHDDVVRAGARVTAAIPLRLATICIDDVSARQHLNEFGDTAREALAKIEGHDEWGVKLYAESGSPNAGASEPSTVTGTAYLEQRRRHLELRQRSADHVLRISEEIYESLSGFASDACRHRPHDRRLTGDDRPMILNAAFLVGRRRESAFRSAVDALAASNRDVSAVLTGPWPAYSFAPEAQT